MKVIRNLETHENYEVHKLISKQLNGSSEPLVFEHRYQGHLLTRNRFPYRTHLDHWVLWIQPGYEKFYTPERIRLIVGNAEDLWENNPQTCSVHGIKHYHVLYNNEHSYHKQRTLYSYLY